jgi:hypothetical protein
MAPPGNEDSRAPSPAPSSPLRPETQPITFVTPRTKRSYRVLEEETRQIHQELVTREQSDKQTRRTYQRRYESYLRWWEASQAEVAREDATRRALPALPITAAKVARFLSHEMTREKVRVPHPLGLMLTDRPCVSTGATVL